MVIIFSNGPFDGPTLSNRQHVRDFSDRDLDPPYDPPYLFDHSNQGYNPNLPVDVEMEGESLVE